jgi:hypothetical protein
MLTQQFRQICYNELQFVIIFSDVKAYSRIFGAKLIIISLPVIPAVVLYQRTSSGEQARNRKLKKIIF